MRDNNPLKLKIMKCEWCKKSRALFYKELDDNYKKYAFEKKTHKVEVIESIDTHVYCTQYEKIVSTKLNDKYCEMERGVFDDIPEKYEPYPEYD